MKAIHNKGNTGLAAAKVGNYMLKYNFESNSQLVQYVAQSLKGWELYAKVQFWKQFTTSWVFDK